MNTSKTIYARSSGDEGVAVEHTWTGIMLVLRLMLFALFQAAFALLFYALGRAMPWEAAANWWPFVATFTNLVCIALLLRLLQREGVSVPAFLNFERSTMGRDLLVALGLFLLSAPFGFLPGVWAGNALFGDVQQAYDLFLRPLPPLAAALGLVLFPVTIGLAELPTYFGYVMPRLAVWTGSRTWALLLTAFFLAAQHITLPFLFDARFVLWRLLMFLPFALYVGVVLLWRPRLLPYFMIGHILIDLQVAWLVFDLSM